MNNATTIDAQILRILRDHGRLPHGMLSANIADEVGGSYSDMCNRLESLEANGEITSRTRCLGTTWTISTEDE